MDHAEATAQHAVDRYLLGELSAAEADAFEEHYFDCADCADELRVGMRFMNGGRGVAREEAAPPEAKAVISDTKVVSIDDRRSRRTAWLPAAVAAALVLAVGAPLLMNQRASGPEFEVANRLSFVNADVRSAGENVPAIDGNATTVLSFDVPPEPAYVRYEARMQRSGGPVLAKSFTPDPDGAPTAFRVHGLSAGPHELAIVGIDDAGRVTEIARHRFVVR